MCIYNIKWIKWKKKLRCFPNCEMFLVWKKHWILKKDKDSLKISYMINYIFLGCI